MIQVKDNESGEVKPLEDDSQLPELAASGKVSIPDKSYEFSSPDGKKYEVGAKGFLEAVNQGWKYRDSKIIKDEELEKKYGNSEISAAGLGLARALTFGASDFAARKSGLLSEEALSNIRDRNPISSTLGEVAGTVGPALLSGGTSLAARIAARTPVGVVARVAERAGARAAENVASTVAKKVVATGIESAIDGAASGVNTTITESQLGDAEFNAETLLQHVGTGALTGAALGIGIGAAAYPIKAAKDKSSEMFRKFISASKEISAQDKASILLKNGLIEEGNQILAKAGTNKDEVLKAYNDAGLKPSWYTGAQDEKYKELVGDIAKGSSLPGKIVSDEINKVHEQLESMGNAVLSGKTKVDPNDFGGSAKDSLTKIIENDDGLSMASALYKARDEFRDAPVTMPLLKRSITNLEKNSILKFSPEAQGVIDNILKIEKIEDVEIVKSGIASMMRDPKVATNGKLVEFLSEAKQSTETLITNSLKYNAKYGPFVKKAKQIEDAMAGFKLADQLWANGHKEYGFLGHVFGVKSKNISQIQRKIADMQPTEIANKILNIKDVGLLKRFEAKFPEIYQVARAERVNRIAEKSMHDGLFSTKKFIKNMRGLNQSERTLLFPNVKDMNGLLGRMETISTDLPPFVNKSSTAYALNMGRLMQVGYQAQEIARYAVLRGGEEGLYGHLTKFIPTAAQIEKASNKSKDKIAHSVSGFFRAASIGVGMGTMEMMSDKEIDKARKSYAEVQSNPEGLVKRFVDNNQTLIKSAPATANALQQRLIAGVQFLQSKTPYKDQEYMGEKFEPSRTELIKFNDYLEAVEKPQIIFEQLKQGYLNPHTLETLRVVYPKTYASIQSEILSKMPKHLTRAQKIQLQPILGTKVTPAMDYQNMMRLQGKTQAGAASREQAHAEMNRVPMGGGKNLKASNRMQTGLDKVINRS